VAVYMSASRQRRRTIAIAVAALVIGVGLGIVLGRVTANSVSDAVDASRSRGRDVAAALRTLPLEYEQARAGSGGETNAGIDDAVARVATMARAAFRKAPWLGPGDRGEVTSAVDAVGQAAHRSASLAEFKTAVDRAATTVEDVFGVSSTAAA